MSAWQIQISAAQMQSLLSLSMLECFDEGHLQCLATRLNFLLSLALQVRCMMAVLLLIGQKLEAPEIINQLLDVDRNPRKPQYR